MELFSVLVVDDEEDFVETLVNRLKKRTIDAVGALNGEDALELLGNREFDVIILDIKMPGGMDGIETLKEIKKVQPLSEVILLTGHASVESSIEGMRCGAFDYVLKPIKLEELFPKIAQAFEKKDVHNQKIRSAKIQHSLRYW